MAQYKGVNLGGWLVLEKWITPSLFQGASAEDEWTLMHELGDRASTVLDAHRQTFISDSDFAWIAHHGLNAVRIPVGYGVFGDAPPFYGGLPYLDFAIETAGQFDLQVLIDLHTAPGSQNGWDHSGRSGAISWATSSDNINQTLHIGGRLAERYKHCANVLGIEVLNEPHWTTNKTVLKDYYVRAHRNIRESGYNGKIIFPDAFDPVFWSRSIKNANLSSAVLDLHLYQCFEDRDKHLTVEQHVAKTRDEWKNLIDRTQQKLPTIVGEWSLALDQLSLSGCDELDVWRAYNQYGNAQLEVFSQALGWFYWTYKTEEGSVWSLRDSVSRGLLPKRF